MYVCVYIPKHMNTACSVFIMLLFLYMITIWYRITNYRCRCQYRPKLAESHVYISRDYVDIHRESNDSK